MRSLDEVCEDDSFILQYILTVFELTTKTHPKPGDDKIDHKINVNSDTLNTQGINEPVYR